MKIKVKFQAINCRIDRKYLYYLQSFIYKKVLAKIDYELSDNIHNRKFFKEKKQITPFGISTLTFKDYCVIDDDIIFYDKYVNFYISTPYDNEIGKLIFLVLKEFEENKTIINIGGKTDLVIKKVEIIKPVEYGQECIFKTISPACVRYKDENGEHTVSLKDTDKFVEYLIKNIKRKYKLYYKEELKDKVEIEILNNDIENSVKKLYFKKGIFETYFLYFKIKCKDTKVMYLVDNWGIGQHNSMGFGTVKLVKVA